MKVNILGTEYTIRKLSEEEYPKLKTMEANGLAELWTKELIIEKNMDDGSGRVVANLVDFEKKVIRHEIVHAFFHESGLYNEYCVDERLVDWIALQIPKIIKAMNEADAL